MGSGLLRAFLLLVLLIALAIAAWLLRLDTDINATGGVVITDRWVGKVYYCGSSECQLLYPK